MSIYEKLDEKYGQFRKDHEDMAWGRYKGPHEHPDDLSDDYEETMKRVLVELTPEEKTEMFQYIVERLQNELEDMWAEMYPGEIIKILLMLQVFNQLVPKE